jgi:hypothetical protein
MLFPHLSSELLLNGFHFFIESVSLADAKDFFTTLTHLHA